MYMHMHVYTYTYVYKYMYLLICENRARPGSLRVARLPQLHAPRSTQQPGCARIPSGHTHRSQITHMHRLNVHRRTATRVTQPDAQGTHANSSASSLVPPLCPG